MDYRNTNSYFHKKTEGILDSFVRRQLARSKDSDRSFNYIDDLVNRTFENRINKFSKNPWFPITKDINSLIGKKKEFYEKHAHKRILSNEALELFSSVHKPEDYKRFLAFLGILNGANESFYNYGLNRKYTELLYKANELDSFTLKTIPGGVEGLDHYYELEKKIYGRASNEPVLYQAEQTINDKNIDVTQSSILNNDEKLFLLHLTFNSKKILSQQFDIPEYVRLMHLTSNAFNEDIMVKEVGKNYSYQKFRTGLGMPKKETDLEFLSNLLQKLEPLKRKLPKTLHEVQYIKSQTL